MARILLNMTLLAIGIAFIAGCSAGGTASPGERTTVAPESHSGVPERSQGLPDPSADRSASVPIDNILLGTDFSQKTSNALVSGDSLQLSSTSTDPSWGIWTVDLGPDRPLEVQVLVDNPADDEFYLALADYSTGRWEFDGPLTVSTTLSLDRDLHKSPLDRVSIAVLTAKGNSITVDRFVLTADRKGWQVVDVDMSEDAGRHCTITDVGGRPAIAYYQSLGSSDSSLWYAVSSTPLGLESSEWTRVLVDTGQQPGHDPDLAIVDGHPAISYRDSVPGTMNYVRSSSPTGDSAADWNGIVVVDDVDTVGQDSSLQVVDGNPAISYYDSTNTALKYARSSTTHGSGASDWTTVRTIEDGGDTGKFTSLMVVDGNPAIAYYNEGAESISFIRSISSTGAGSTDWIQYSIVDTDPDITGEVAIVVADGNPAVFYTNVVDRNLHYSRSTTASGSMTDDWSQYHLIDNRNHTNIHIQATDVVGNPAVAYVDFENAQVLYSRSTNKSGIGGGLVGWTNYTVHSAEPGQNLSELDIATVADRPVICFSHTSPDGVKYAILLE